MSGTTRSIDYSEELKLLEIEYRELGSQRIYHYVQAETSDYNKIVKLKKQVESLPRSLPKEIKEKYSIGRFVNYEVKRKYDYYP